MPETHAKTFLVEEIELTPNPRSVKFILDQKIIDSGSKTIEGGSYLESDSFAHNLFALDIVDVVYLRENFVSVTLTSADLWVIFKDKVKNIIEADLRKYADGDDEVSSSILDDFDKEKYPHLADDEKAIIVDERFNGGGQLADYVIDLLNKPMQSYWNFRYGKDMKAPSASIQGPKVMLIDETAGSGGDYLPYLFRRNNLGTLVGKRTWGGLVGVLGYPEFIDGGYVTAPNVAFYNEEGFGIENVGTPPDVEVEQTPKDVIAGKDPQLEKAIEIILQQLEDNPWLAGELFSLFEIAKKPYLEFLHAGSGLTPADQALLNMTKIVGDDPIPYGLESSNKTIETFIKFNVDQKVIPESVDLDTLFAV